MAPTWMSNLFVPLTALCHFIIYTAAGLTLGPSDLLTSTSPSDLHSASLDFGLMKQAKPVAVLHPRSAEDVAALLKSAYGSSEWYPVSSRGHGHSINGQAHAQNGVVIQMTRSNNSIKPAPENPRVNVEELYVDTWGGELWVDVLSSTLKYGLAPKSWTDYLYLTVGGTISNAGISGQAFNHGPQITNVLQLQVVTGKGDIMRCSEEENSELFNSVLGGLGQFGIITKARIALEPAPQMVRWIRVLYSNFTEFTMDQEYLISLHEKPSSKKFDYVEGFVIVEEGLINNWRSSFFSPRNPVKISSLASANRGNVLYCLEITKNYFDSTPLQLVHKEVESLLNKLKFIPSTVFTTDIPYVEFLDRVHKSELKLRSKGLWEVPHPWLNLFVPKSRIADFDRRVFKGILGNRNKTSGPILIYPMNNNKFDGRTSVVTPDEEVFYLVGLLRSALEGGDEAQSMKYLTHQNNLILKFCKEANIQVKQYLPHYASKDEWMNHFGNKWDHFYRMKKRFDPRHILASGQHIFEPYPTHKNVVLLQSD